MPQTRQSNVPPSPSVKQLEELPQRVVAYGRDLDANNTLPWHRHRRAQLVYASTGVMSVITRLGNYIVPPQRAVWLPGGVEHSIEARSSVQMRTLYIEQNTLITLPNTVCVLHVTPLLRELIVTAVAEGPRYHENSAQSRMMDVILDQIMVQPKTTLALPMPTDTRALRIAQALIQDPTNSNTLEAWAEAVGASKRTLARIFSAQTGMSYGQWRQQRRLLRALELLATNDNITNIAIEVGYRNTSAFIAMFKRHFGTTPANYLKKSLH